MFLVAALPKKPQLLMHNIGPSGAASHPVWSWSIFFQLSFGRFGIDEERESKGGEGRERKKEIEMSVCQCYFFLSLFFFFFFLKAFFFFFFFPSL
jgi:hypothetical protein